jgi:hypothetical protein
MGLEHRPERLALVLSGVLFSVVAVIVLLVKNANDRLTVCQAPRLSSA